MRLEQNTYCREIEKGAKTVNSKIIDGIQKHLRRDTGDSKERNMQEVRSQKLLNELYNEGRVICTGKILQKMASERMSIEISFMSGTAYALNYIIMKGLCVYFERKCYLEIGSYIGDSIYNVKDVCDKCISITAPIRAPWSMDGYCKKYRIPNFSNRLVVGENIEQFFTNSQKFDFRRVKDKPDIILIDGEESYKGIKHDTENMKKIKSDDAIIIWQLTKLPPSGRVACMDIWAGIRDALTKEEWKNCYVFDNSSFGIYIPPKFAPKIEDCLKWDRTTLYTYELNVKINERKKFSER